MKVGGLQVAAGSVVEAADLIGDVAGLCSGAAYDGIGFRDLGTQRGQEHPLGCWRTRAGRGCRDGAGLGGDRVEVVRAALGQGGRGA